MKFRRTLAALAVGLAASAPALATNSLTFQGVTFNTWAVDADTLGFQILDADVATGNWTGVNFLKAFEFKDIGASISAASIASGPSGFAVDLSGGVNANAGCTGGSGSGNACFFASPAVALTSNMSWTIDFTGTGLDFSAPHLKVQFLTNLDDRKATGDLLSLAIPAVPEPESYALLLAGLGLMGAVVRRRSR